MRKFKRVSEDSYGGSTALINQSLETINKLKSQFFGYCASKADLNAVEDYLYKVADIMETAVDRYDNKSAHKASLYSSRKESRSYRRRIKESYSHIDPVENLEMIKDEDDGIAEFATLGSYINFYCLVPYASDYDPNDYRGDIAGCLEYTLHKLIDNGYEDNVGKVMGAFKRDYDNEWQNEQEEYGELINIDLGYCIPSLTSFYLI